jgi:soluble lytic murein transglycosylase-like protein
MATLTLAVPVISPVVLNSPTSWYKTRDGLKEQMKNTWAKYGKWFKYYAETSKVPAEILLAFAMVESGGNPLAGGSNSKTQGLMQWNRTFTGGTGNPDFTLSKEFLKGRLSQAEKEKLASFKITFDAKGNTRTLTQADLQNPELNILIGSIILGQYIDEVWGKDPDGKIRMDRIIAKYNWGLKGFKENGLATKNIKDVLANVPLTTKTYIEKMLGKNGALDIAVNDKITA